MEKVITLTRNNKLEVVTGNKKGEVQEERMGILYEDLTFEPIGPDELKQFADYKDKLRKRLVRYYNALLSGEEEIMVMKTGDDECRYLLTSETLLSEGWESPKFTEVFEAAFGPAAIKKLGIHSEVEGYSCVLSAISHISYRSKVTKVKLSDLFYTVNKKGA